MSTSESHGSDDRISQELERGLQSESPEMRRVLEKIRAVAPTSTTVLLTGETGTGKGLLAKFLHFLSHRREGAFLAVHCGATPDALLESEMFGHEKGSFTGAYRRKLGKFEMARGGTLFLDEVGTLTPSAQIMLLQVLQDSTFQRVGGEEFLEANVRLVAATNSDLGEMQQQGAFRSDLFYRLNVFPVNIPPLRRRIEDLPTLAAFFLDRLNQIHSKQIVRIHPDAIRALASYSWPGNVRELQNVLERAYVLETRSELTLESLPSDLFRPHAGRDDLAIDRSRTLAEVRHAAIEAAERRYLAALLTTFHGRIGATAKAAGITPRQLRNLLAKYGLRKEGFKASAEATGLPEPAARLPNAEEPES